MELEASIYDELCERCESANELMDDEKYGEAIEQFESALSLLPEPATDWDAATMIWASIGDAQFQLRQPQAAIDAFYNAMNSPGGIVNPFVLLRAGQCALDLGDEQKAVDLLLRAYMLEGEDIFEDEPGEYLQFLASKVEL